VRANSVALSGHILIHTSHPGPKPWAHILRFCWSAAIEPKTENN
jgi:hypothetical protein